MKKIFLTGSTGFIGHALALKLVAEGHEVNALVRSPKKAEKLKKAGVKIHLGDVTDRESIGKAIEGCEQVFHLAAYAQAWAKDPSAFYKINVGGSMNVLEEAGKRGVEKIVVTSTGGTIGPSGEEPVDEKSYSKPELMTEYEKSKTRLEEKIAEIVDQGLHVVIVNPARVFGPGPMTDSNAEVRVMKQYIKGRFRFLPGDGSSTGSYIYIDDVVKGHLLAMKKGRTGQRYILGGENASFREFFNMVGKVSGKTYRMYGVPIPFLMAFAHSQLFLAKNFGRYPLLTPELVRKYTKKWNFSCEKARRELGYSFLSLEEAVERTLKWMI